MTTSSISFVCAKAEQVNEIKINPNIFLYMIVYQNLFITGGFKYEVQHGLKTGENVCLSMGAKEYVNKM